MELLFGDWQAQLAVLANVAFAALLGGIVGFEREIAARPAGLRTNMLLAAAAALLVAIADLLAERFAGERYAELVRVDPVRVIEAVVTGVAFLGAGTIFRRGHDMVSGLTTAASMLLVAAIGIAVGLAQYVLALGAAVLALVVLRVLAALGQRAAESARETPSQPSPK
ncbi:MAG TPA: MgtC/SapB family protein [Trueperaceae bacterium]